MVWESLSKRLSRLFTLPRLGSSANPHRLPYAALKASVSALVYRAGCRQIGWRHHRRAVTHLWALADREMKVRYSFRTRCLAGVIPLGRHGGASRLSLAGC